MTDPNQKPAPSAPPKPIPVAHLWLDKPTDVPGKSVATSVSSGKPGGRAYHEVEYLPHLRHHRVTWHALEGEPVSRMVHESRVASWEPA